MHAVIGFIHLLIACTILFFISGDNYTETAQRKEPCNDVAILVNDAGGSLTSCPSTMKLNDVMSVDGKIFILCVCADSDRKPFIMDKNGSPLEYDI
jgi:hypothetical protein